MADGTFETIYARRIELAPVEDDEDGVVVKKPSATWVGDALKLLDEEGEDRFRVTSDGRVGCETLHVTPGTNMEGTLVATQGNWYDPRVDDYGYMIDTPPAIDPDTLEPIPWTKDYMVFRDRRGPTPIVRGRIGNKGYLISKMNTAPTTTDLNVGEFAPWFNPFTGVFSMTGKKNDGTLVTRPLI